MKRLTVYLRICSSDGLLVFVMIVLSLQLLVAFKTFFFT